MPIKLGETAVSLSSAIVKVMLGDALVWPVTSGPVNYTISEIDSLEHDTANGTYNAICMIDATHFILAYTGTDGDGFVKTFSIDANCDNITEIDSLEHDTADGTYNSLALINSTHFALAYTGTSGDGFIKTFSVDANCDNITLIDSLEHDTADGTYNSLSLIDSTHLILAYTGTGSDGFVKTFGIDANCDNITQVDFLEYETSRGQYASLAMINSTHFAIACLGNGLNGFVKTFSIDANSDNITLIDSLQHDTYTSISYGHFNSLAVLNSAHLVLAHAGTSTSKGLVKTFGIDANCDNIALIDSLEHDATNGSDNSLVVIDSTHFILANAGADTDGFIKTFSVDANCDNITLIDSLEHDTSNGTFNSLAMLDSTHFALGYTGTGSDGFVKTFSID